MTLLFELLPLFAFFIAYKLAGPYVATAVIMGVTVLQMLVQHLQAKPISMMQWLSLLLLGLMGSATLFFQNVWFIKWKPTLLYWLLALFCLLSPYFGEKIILPERLLGKIFPLQKTIWLRLNRYWVLFFSALGGLNLLIAYQAHMDTWVNLKLFGLSGLTLLFVIIQTIYLSRSSKMILPS